MASLLEEQLRESPAESWTAMIHAQIQAPSYHLLFEACLIIWIIRLLFFTSSYKTERTRLTTKEKEELLRDWQPEPLVPDVDVKSDEGLQNINQRLIHSKVGKYVTVGGQECLNLASLNFLGMIGRPEIEEAAVETLRKYGVGTCGPRGFYGTMDVHLEIEEKLAQFMQCEEAIVYSYGFACTASAIPAYSKRGDVIFCDEGACFAIQMGLVASRSRIVFFKHNDMEDLERVLEAQRQDDIKNPKKAKATRRFLVVEGLYMNYGDICPLPKLVELKEKYKVRIFMDESVSFGVLGEHGRGVTEYYNMSVDDVDMICVSLENALASIGGFCCGKAYVIDHQRLSGQGYCFSASQPAMMATAAMRALDILQQDPALLVKLEENTRTMHTQLKKIPGLHVASTPNSPVQHVQLESTYGDRQDDCNKLQEIVLKAEAAGLALTQARYLQDEIHIPPPSIRVTVNSSLEAEDISRALRIIEEACKEVLK